MTNLRLLGASLLAAAVAWLVLTWPLAPHLFDGVSVSSRNIELGGARAMMPSDQLQLEYHFWLLGDMLAGETPWFHNVYEFNTGDDDERFWPYAYFVPFSLVYRAASALGGRAFGMNMTGLVSLWFTVYFTFLLLRRFTDRQAVVAVATVIALCFPFRWVALLGGSPGGYAMVYVPLLAWGLDVAVRDRTWTGGVAAGAAILLLCWGDVQLFALAGLSLPFWCLLSWCHAEDRTFTLKPWAISLSPLFVFIAAAFGYRAVLQPFLDRATMAGGRALSEVAGFSAHWTGLFSWADGGIENHVFFGCTAVALLAAGIVLVRGRNRWPYLMLIAAALFLVCMSLGPNGPVDGILFRAARKVIPTFDMIRQPARVLGMMPTVLGLAMVFVLSAIKKRSLVLCVLGGVVAVEYTLQVRNTVCLLDESQGAYAAVAADSDQRPHVLVVPLWPGESDSGSLYQYYASLYRIRMVNGYSPVVAEDYFTNIFRRFEPVNQGYLDDGRLDELLERGVGHLVVHEDQFPEKVSPFPVATTLCRLLDHPRLKLLTRDGPVWAFKIETKPVQSGHSKRVLYSYFPTRFRELERQAEQGNAERVEDPGASGGASLRLARRGAWVKTKALRTGPANRLRWEVRVRGKGTLLSVQRADGHAFDHQAVSVNSDEWAWHSAFLRDLSRFARIEQELFWESGDVEVDVAYLTAGRWPPFQSGLSRTIPATALFHAGHGDMDTGAVTLRSRYEPDDAILYGPNLPLEPGVYSLELDLDPGLARDVIFGEVRVGGTHCFDVTSERKPIGEFRVENNLPLRIEFRYTRAADLTIRNLILTRHEDYYSGS